MVKFIPNTDRTTLVKLFNAFGFKEGAEIGVANGDYSDVICRENPNVKLFCIDSWIKYDGYNDKAPDTFADSEQIAREKLSKYNCVFVKKFSMDALEDFEDESLDFVYIDANHSYKSVLEDITEWSKKVKKGGIVSGHDYDEIKPALEEYGKDYFVLGRNEKTEGERRKSSRSWFFIKGE